MCYFSAEPRMCRNALKMFEMQNIAKPVKMLSRCASMPNIIWSYAKELSPQGG